MKTGHPAWPPPRQAWYAVFIFGLSLMVNMLDRGILGLLIPSIKSDLRLSDTEISLIVGFAFVIFYAVLGLPIARLSDTRSRRMIIGISISIWSGMTALCGLAQNFWQLFVLRMGVGVGEAGSGPATYSMMADLFPRSKLPWAISVLSFGFVTGSGLALIIGGLIVSMFADFPQAAIPVFGVLQPWQLTLMTVGLPGLLIAVLMTTVKEPVRRGLIGQTGGKPPRALPIGQVFRFLQRNWKTYAPMTIGMAIKSALNFGNAIWLPTLFVRKHGWAMAKIGITQGVLLLTVAPLGLLAGSYVAARLAARGHDDANVRAVIYCGFAGIPLAVAWPMVSDPDYALMLYAIAVFVQYMLPGPQNAALQIITPNQMRAQVTALWLFVLNVIGFGMGPTIVALLTDFLFHDEARIGDALAMASGSLGVVAIVVILFGLKPYAASVRRAREWDTG
jgi:MFS family permease